MYFLRQLAPAQLEYVASLNFPQKLLSGFCFYHDFLQEGFWELTLHLSPRVMSPVPLLFFFQQKGTVLSKLPQSKTNKKHNNSVGEY